ncbi:MAG: M6 family metalloprotease domain-containing protein [bacterium]
MISSPRAASFIGLSSAAGAVGAALVTGALALFPSFAHAITPRNPDLAAEARKAGVRALPAPPDFPAIMKQSGETASGAIAAAVPLRALGHVDVAILLIDYDDNIGDTFDRRASFFSNLAFADAGKSMKTYYDENSYGQLELGGAVVGWLRSPRSFRYFVNGDRTAGTADDYGFDTSPAAFNPATDPYPHNVWGIVMEAVNLADSLIDFSEFDGNGDGIVDALCVVHAGPGAEEAFAGLDDFIWSHKSNVTDYLASVSRGPLATRDGVTIGDYIMTPATGRLGVLCHEFGHLFGLPDLYRTDATTREQSSVVGGYDLMDFGPWLDGGITPGHLGAWCKYTLGWIDPAPVSLEAGAVRAIAGASLFSTVAESPDGAFYRILSNPSGADWTARRVGRGEYFLLENRVAGRDNFDRFLFDSGLAIWHVDESRANNNSVNANEHLLTLVQADGDDWTGFAGDPRGQAGDLWPGSRTDRNFTAETTPNTRLHNGGFSGAEITNIEQFGAVIEADLAANAIRFGASYAFPNPLKMSEDGAPEIAFVFEPQSALAQEQALGGGLVVRIHDLSGALVRRLTSDASPAMWDCRNSGGEMVASGAYFYVVESGGEVADGKVVILH